MLLAQQLIYRGKDYSTVSSSIAFAARLERSMLSRPHRRVIIVLLACYFTSKIIIAIQKLQDEKIGTVFNKINKDVVEVECLELVLD